MKTLLDKWDDYLRNPPEESLRAAIDEELSIVSSVAQQVNKVLHKKDLKHPGNYSKMDGIKAEVDGCSFIFNHELGKTEVLWTTNPQQDQHETIIASGLFLKKEELESGSENFVLPEGAFTIYTRTPLTNPLSSEDIFTFGKIIIYDEQGIFIDFKFSFNSTDEDLDIKYESSILTTDTVQCDLIINTRGKRIRLPGAEKGQPSINLSRKIDIAELERLTRKQVEKYQIATIKKLSTGDVFSA